MSAKIRWKRKMNRFIKKKRFLSGRFLVCSFLFLLVIGGFFVYQYVFLPQIHLAGKKSVVLAYQKKYSEKGYKASFLGNDVTKDVVVKGKVNSNKLGTYNIEYVVKEGFFKKKVVRTIVVKDLEKPKMNINDDDIYLCPGDEIVPEKVEVSDNYDKDLSDYVENVISKERDSITYKVCDKSRNCESITKKIIFGDREAPIITLNGSEDVSVFVGNDYEDSGVSVSDNCDKDISSKVVIDGSVNTNKVGTYEISYMVEDNYQNKASVKRRVHVKEKGRGIIYLTFDDGPNSGTTDVILNILKEEGVKATFFVTNKGSDDLIKREFDEGHTVALHTASHNYAILYASDEAYFNDLYSVQERVKRITGYESKIIRFPGGSSNTISRRYSNGIMSRLTQEVQKRGFRYYDWNVSSGDAAGGNPAPSQIYNNVVNALRYDRVNMVLMHDIKTYTRDALRDIIRFGKENGYTFEKITMDTDMITQRVNN